MSAPERIQRKRTKGWTMPEGAVYVGRPTKWGNPFGFRHYTGLVRYQPSAPDRWEYEGRISADGTRHDYYGPDGTITEFWVRYATRSELVRMYRQTMLDPTSSMRSAYPSRGGHFLKVTADDIRTELAGKDLACWCALDQPCHADVLLRIANDTTSTAGDPEQDRNDLTDGGYVRFHYGVPARRGVHVVVDGTPGVIAGFNSQYLLVLFDGNSEPLPAHPTWHVEYLAADVCVTGGAK